MLILLTIMAAVKECRLPLLSIRMENACNVTTTTTTSTITKKTSWRFLVSALVVARRDISSWQDWKPVKDLRVQNNGHSLIVTSDMPLRSKRGLRVREQTLGDDSTKRQQEKQQLLAAVAPQHVKQEREARAERHRFASRH